MLHYAVKCSFIFVHGIPNFRIASQYIKYLICKWNICKDHKLAFSLVYKGYTKHQCFLCRWDSQNVKQHYSILEKIGIHLKKLLSKIFHVSLLDPAKVSMPKQIKLGLLKNLIKQLILMGMD